MKLSKLKKLHVIIIGSVLCVLAGVGVFFLLVKPQQEALKKTTADYDAAIVLGNPQAEEKAIRDLNMAISKVNLTQQSLEMQMNRCMPDLSFARRDMGMLALWNEQIKTLGPLLKSFARDKSVTLLGSNFNIPAPPVNPNDPVFDQDVLVFPLGTVQVSGDFKNVMNNIRRWNNCQRLIMVSAPKLMGQSPQLMAAYDLTCYIFPVAKGGAKIPMAGMGTATGQPGQPGMP